MTISFEDFYERLRKATDIRTQIELATALGLNRSAITQAKVRDAVPQKWVLALARRYSLSPDWLEFGKGERRLSASKEPYGEVMMVPKVAATVSAGGGSYEVGALPVSTHPFPRRWLAKMGSPSSMVFMDVVGDSMQPEIYDGDMVLIDQSFTRISPHNTYAIGYDDTLYIKRLEKRNDAVILHSNNPSYSDIELYGDELSTFRVIGKVVWLCRDCRYS